MEPLERVRMWKHIQQHKCEGDSQCEREVTVVIRGKAMGSLSFFCDEHGAKA